MKGYDEDQLNAASILLGNGFSFNKICKIFKVDKSRFALFLENNGIRNKKQNHQRIYDYNSDLCIQIVNDYKNGMHRSEIIKKYSIHDGLMYRILSYHGINLQGSIRKYMFDESYFENINTEHKAYWLGFLYADGYISEIRNKIELTLKESDENHIIKFMNDINYNGNIIHKNILIGQKYFNASRIDLFSQTMTKSLIKAGCVQNKSLILKFPNNNIIPNKLQHHFMRGYFDGDGSITTSRQGRDLRFSVLGTYDFLKQYDSILTLNGANSKIPKKEKSKAYHLQYGGNVQVRKIFNFLYDNASIYLERKYNIFIAVLGQKPTEGQE